MMSTQKNNIQNITAPHPVFLQVVPAPIFNFGTAPSLQFADLTAATYPSLITPPMPILPSPTLTPISNVSSTTNILFYDGSTVSNVPSYLTPTINNGILTPPQGFSFATINFNAPPAQAEDTDSTGNVEDLTCSSSEPTPEPVAPKPVAQKPRKFKHGSKQEKIMEVYNRIQEKYTAQGVYAGEHEVLRGPDTVRVHVKTFKGLDKVEAALQEVDDCPDVQLRKLATPFSMKNRFQKKGFIVYLRLISPDMVDSVKAVFKKYEEFFRKCDVAMPKPTDPQPNITEPVDSKISDFFDAADNKGNAPFFPLPLPMAKQSSVPSDAA